MELIASEVSHPDRFQQFARVIKFGRLPKLKMAANAENVDLVISTSITNGNCFGVRISCGFFKNHKIFSEIFGYYTIIFPGIPFDFNCIFSRHINMERSGSDLEAKMSSP